MTVQGWGTYQCGVILLYSFMGGVIRIVRKSIMGKCCIGTGEVIIVYDFMGIVIRIVMKKMCCISTAVNDVLSTISVD